MRCRSSASNPYHNVWRAQCETLHCALHSGRPVPAVAFKGDFEANVAKIAAWGYDGVELPSAPPGR